MHKKAIIFDLDNTIYSVNSIAETLFKPLFELISEHHQDRDIDKIKDELKRRPFQLVAKEFQFSEALITKGTHLLERLSYDGPIKPYPDYHFTKQLNVDKFLVTTGFTKLQQSKIDGLNITANFKEIHIVDPSLSSATKKDAFADIMERHNFHPTEILVVGDDLESEIRAARELGIGAVLYDHDDVHTSDYGIEKIRSMEEVKNFI